jgi:heme oxygenase
LSDPTSPLLAALRDGTRDLHDRTEAAFVLGEAARVTRPVYAEVLARLHDFYAAAEAALGAWAPALAAHGVDVAARHKAALLRRDLAALGSRPPALPGGAAPAGAFPAPAVPTAAHAFGLAYVLEGATLGGQLLRRRLGPALGLTPERGLAFFAAYGAEVGPMWRAFTAALDRFDRAAPAPDRPAARAAAVAGARAAFLAFERDVVAPTAVRAATPDAGAARALTPAAP